MLETFVGFSFRYNWQIDRDEECFDLWLIADRAQEIFGFRPVLVDVQLEKEWSVGRCREDLLQGE